MATSIRTLVWNEASIEELARHGLRPEDAEAALESGIAKRFRQAARMRRHLRQSTARQPERIKMIGPDRSGRLLTIILELPDDNGLARIVTGWQASAGERSRDHRPGGRPA